jgi:hypothetical protein
MFVKASTENPLGKRPWNFALSRNGLSFYEAAQFPVPFPSRPPRAGLGAFSPDQSTLPAAPAGYQYQQAADGITWILVPVPHQGPNPLLLLALAGGALWYFNRKKKFLSLPVVKI